MPLPPQQAMLATEAVPLAPPSAQPRAPVQRVRPGNRALGEFAVAYRCRSRDITIGRVGVGLRLTEGARVWELDPIPGTSGQQFERAGPQGFTRVAFQGADPAVVVDGSALGGCALTRQWPMASFRATGHEPAWLLKGETELLRWTIADKLFATAVSNNQPLALAQALRVGDEPDAPLVSVFHAVCRDTATGMPYPYTVQVAFDGRTLNGCGGDPGALLIGREWVITGMDTGAVAPAGFSGAPLSPLGHHVSIRFDHKGRVSGAAHCNLFNGIYALTGERLSVGSVAATRRACLGTAMHSESALLRALETVVGFDVSAAGELTLVTREAAERGVVAGIRAR